MKRYSWLIALNELHEIVDSHTNVKYYIRMLKLSFDEVYTSCSKSPRRPIHSVTLRDAGLRLIYRVTGNIHNTSPEALPPHRLPSGTHTHTHIEWAKSSITAPRHHTHVQCLRYTLLYSTRDIAHNKHKMHKHSLQTLHIYNATTVYMLCCMQLINISILHNCSHNSYSYMQQVQGFRR